VESVWQQCFDQPPTQGEIVVARDLTQLKVVRQYHPGIDVKRVDASHTPNRRVQQVDVTDKQVVRVEFEQVYAEKVATAWYTITAIVRHVRMPRWSVQPITT